jgi:hypothetical protein
VAPSEATLVELTWVTAAIADDKPSQANTPKSNRRRQAIAKKLIVSTIEPAFSRVHATNATGLIAIPLTATWAKACFPATSFSNFG